MKQTIRCNQNTVSDVSKSMACKLSLMLLRHLVNDCIYFKFSSANKFVLFLVLYVDDILKTRNNIGLLHNTKIFLRKNFKMKDAVDTFFFIENPNTQNHSLGIIDLCWRSQIDLKLKYFILYMWV